MIPHPPVVQDRLWARPVSVNSEHRWVGGDPTSTRPGLKVSLDLVLPRMVLSSFLNLPIDIIRCYAD